MYITLNQYIYTGVDYNILTWDLCCGLLLLEAEAIKNVFKRILHILKSLGIKCTSEQVSELSYISGYLKSKSGFPYHPSWWTLKESSATTDITAQTTWICRSLKKQNKKTHPQNTTPHKKTNQQNPNKKPKPHSLFLMLSWSPTHLFSSTFMSLTRV